MHASRDEATSSSATTTTLSMKSVAFLNATQDLRPTESDHDLLRELLTRILTDEEDLDVILAV